MSNSVIQIPPKSYVHILDTNTNITRVERGPQTITRKSHEELVFGPSEMILIPPSHFAYILNPVVRNERGEIVTDGWGVPQHRWSDYEVRLTGEPFALYPNERLAGQINPLHVVAENTALRLRATRDFADGKTPRAAGTEWLFYGPATYYPRVECEVVTTVIATLLKENQALKLRTLVDTRDANDKPRKAGEEWYVFATGYYLPRIDEEVVGVVEARVLTNTKAIQLRALQTFTDAYKVTRKAGAEWLVTNAMSPTHIIDVNEEVVQEVFLNTLTSTQFCTLKDPVENGVNLLGVRRRIVGVCSFFLQPGESLERGIQEMYVLRSDQALLLQADENFKDTSVAGEPVRAPGDRWLLPGPCNYVPPLQVRVLETRSAIPLDQNEGIYVKDMRTGRVRAEIGHTYMLNEHETLWQKDLPPSVEALLAGESPFVGSGDMAAGSNVSMVQGMQTTMLARTQGSAVPSGGPRDKTRVVSFRVPHNAAAQVYDFRARTNRVVFGPEFVMLTPDEQFTQLSLSGGKPKRAHQIRTIMLFLGPDFMTDIVGVETADHARLSMTLSYNWHFDLSQPGAEKKIFSIPDFVGDACKSIASRVRSAVAAVPFHEFHTASARIIRNSVFGVDKAGNPKKVFAFDSNCLVITSIDIQNVEPVDQRTRDALQRSVQMAIEITTNSLEQTASFEADQDEQASKGELERQKIIDAIECERSRIKLLKVQSESRAVATLGRAKAEAKARAEAAEIEGAAAVAQAKLIQQAMNIDAKSALESMSAHRWAKVDHQEAIDNLELERKRQLAAIESKKFKDTVTAIGPQTIKSLAQAGPEMQAQLLKSLGLSGYLVTDGNSPINLFNTASGLIGGGRPLA